MAELSKRQQAKLEDNPIRTCSEKCYFFDDGQKGCQYFQKKKVQFGEKCLHDIMELKKYADAFAQGDTAPIKEDAARITASLMMQLHRMLEEIHRDGPVLDVPIRDAKGQAVWIPDPKWDPESGEPRQNIVAMDKKDHPLLARVVQLARQMGINLNDFKLTPKSAEEKREVSGNIIGSEEDISVVMAERKIIEEKFVMAVEKGSARTKEDKVYKQLMEEGDIVE